MERIAIPPLPRVDARDLRLVIALAQAGSTAAAAPALHLSQSAVSRGLIDLEERLGLPLFDRTPRGLQLTQAGAQLAEEGTRLLSSLQGLEHRVRKRAAPRTSLRLVCECYTAYHWLPSALQNLRSSMPDVEITVAAEHTNAPVDALQARQIDVALLTAATAPPGELVERPLFSDEVVFILSANQPLAAHAALSREDLRGQTLLSTTPPRPDMHWFNKPVSGSRGIHYRYQCLPLTEAVLDFARAGLGIAVLSEWIAAPHLAKGDLVAKRLVSGPLHRPWRIAWRREVQDVASRLRAALQQSTPRAWQLHAPDEVRPRRQPSHQREHA